MLTALRDPAALSSGHGAVAILEKLSKDEPAYLYDLARYRALCGSLLIAGKKEPPAEAARCYADAMEALRKAVAAGFDNAHQLRTDPYLAPLRSGEDFRK